MPNPRRTCRFLSAVMGATVFTGSATVFLLFFVAAIFGRKIANCKLLTGSGFNYMNNCEKFAKMIIFER